MDCLKFWPLPECGINGDCVEDNNGTRFCQCNSGFSQTLELNYFVEEEDLQSSICIYHEDAVNGLYVCLIVVIVLSSFLIVVNIERTSQMFRTLPFIIFSVFLFGVSIYRLVNPQALFGKDFAFTFCLTLTAPLSQIQGYIFTTKYLYYMARKIELNEHKTFFLRAENARKLFLFIIILSSFSMQCLWISLWAKRETSLLVYRIVFAVQIVRVSYQIFFMRISIQELINDMEVIIQTEEETNSFASEKLVRYLKQKVPKVRLMRKRLAVAGIMELFIWTVVLIWDFALLLGTYLVPLLYISIFGYQFASFLSKYSLKGRCSLPGASKRSEESNASTVNETVASTEASKYGMNTTEQGVSMYSLTQEV